jgi:hypothetical protein
MRSCSLLVVGALGVLALGPACNCGLEQLETPRPRMLVSPERVVLNNVAVAQDTRIVIQVSNPSIVHLDGLHAELAEGSDPSFRIRDTPENDEVLAGTVGEVVVVVRPLTATNITATLVLTADAPARPARVEVPLIVNAIDAGLPDICDYPESIAFEGVGRSDVGRADVKVKNCGVRDLLLDEVFFCATPAADETPDENGCGADDTIRITTQIEPGFPVGINESASLQLVFAPEDLLPHTGDVVILSNDPDENPVVIPVTGTGKECPTAAATLVDGAEGIEPFDVVRIDGRDSIPAGGVGVGPGIEEYAWTIEQRPIGSTAILSSETADRVELPVDLAGRYVVTLEVTDSEGVRSCEPASVTFDVVPSEELLVQLVWDHATADLDLHMLRDGSEPFTHEGDVYFSNREPVGAPWSDDPAENPNLDHDDSRGYGPENINIVHPAAGSHWTLLVHYWNKQTDGSARTTATVRVFVYGQQVIEITRTFEEDQQLWKALDITWPDVEGDPASLSQIGVVEPFPRPF